MNSTTETTTEFRAYDTTTEWSGPVRATLAAAERDAIAVTRDPEAPSRMVDAETGETVWPPHGRSTGAARWR